MKHLRAKHATLDRKETGRLMLIVALTGIGNLAIALHAFHAGTGGRINLLSAAGCLAVWLVLALLR